MEKNDKIRRRAVIRYLGLKGKAPKHYQYMEATIGDKEVIKMTIDKEVGWQIQTWQEQHGRHPRAGRPLNAQFCQFFFPSSSSSSFFLLTWYW